jgi:hypothetical protein
MMFIKANLSGADDAAGQAVWGFKAKIISMEGNLPIEYLMDETKNYSHRDYPVGWAVFLSFLSLCAGRYDDALLNNANVFISLLVFISIVEILRKSSLSANFALIMGLILCGNRFFLYCSTMPYAEPLLILCVLWAVYFGMEYLKNGNDLDLLFNSFLFAFCALIKNEGILLCGLNIFMMVLVLTIKSREEKGFKKLDILRAFFVLVLPLLFAVLPWLALKWAVGIKSYDFSFSRLAEMDLPEFMNVIKSSVKEVGTVLFFNWRTNFVFCFCLPVILVFFIGKGKKEAGTFYCICLGLLYIFLIYFSFVFSTRPLPWHLRSAARVLLVPQFIIAIAALKGLNTPSAVLRV